MAGHLRLVTPDAPKGPKKYRKTPLFSQEEAARIRAALRHARVLFGSWSCVAAALRTSQNSIVLAAWGRRNVSGDLAVRLARALGKPLESLYRALAAADLCPTCGAKRGAS